MIIKDFFDYKKVKDSFGGYLYINYPLFFQIIHRHKTGVKYVFSGGMAATVNLFFLYFLTDIIGIWYLTSSVIAFILSFFTSFFLQKFWTFRDGSLKHIKKQFFIYIIMGAANFFSGPALLFVFVEFFHIWYLFGQIFVMGGLAILNYLINKFITFKKDSPHESTNV